MTARPDAIASAGRLGYACGARPRSGEQNIVSAAIDSTDDDFDKAVEAALKQMQWWSQNAWRYEYVVHRNGGEVIVRLEKVR